MVSLRRRRLLGLCSGLPDSAVAPCPMYFDDEGVAQFGTPPANQVTHPFPSTEMKNNAEIANSLTGADTLNMVGPNSSNHQNNQENGEQAKPEQAKPKNRDKKKNVNEQELSSIRGVYCKNMKWQAAIKVNKKQIHLGTLETQEEAARVYDRAAFMRGRAPNFELPEDEKEELRQLNWEEFLEKTKLEISCKRKRKHRDEAGSADKSHQVDDFQNEPGQGAEGVSSSEVAELSNSPPQ